MPEPSSSKLPDLRRDYGLVVSMLRPHPGGFQSECWVADDTWFVKRWRHAAAPQRLELLRNLGAAGLPVPAPIRTLSGSLFAMCDSHPYAVFPYIRGRTASGDDWLLTARALGRVHALRDIALPAFTMDEPDIWRLREQLGHPWIANRRVEVEASIERLVRTIDLAARQPVRMVVCHRDFGGLNLLIEADEVVAILDWEQAVWGPREHDIWMAAEGPHGASFLEAYGAHDLNLTHIEYALLARALRDMAARVLHEVDRPGVDSWGFERVARLNRDLEMFRPFCGPPTNLT